MKMGGSLLELNNKEGKKIESLTYVNVYVWFPCNGNTAFPL